MAKLRRLARGSRIIFDGWGDWMVGECISLGKSQVSGGREKEAGAKRRNSSLATFSGRGKEGQTTGWIIQNHFTEMSCGEKMLHQFAGIRRVGGTVHFHWWGIMRSSRR